MSPPRSITAPWPAKIERPVAGETTARVTPAARLIAIVEACGLIAGTTSSAALNGEVFAVASLVGSTASTSTMPIREKPATTPGVTQRPLASIRSALAGTATLAPAATTRPSRTSTVPPSIGGEPSPITTRPPVIATVWAAAGAAASAAMPARRSGEPSQCTSPSPGWPSSKSLTGRSRGLFMSYIIAPSIQTCCGRV